MWMNFESFSYTTGVAAGRPAARQRRRRPNAALAGRDGTQGAARVAGCVAEAYPVRCGRVRDCLQPVDRCEQRMEPRREIAVKARCEGGGGSHRDRVGDDIEADRELWGVGRANEAMKVIVVHTRTASSSSTMKPTPSTITTSSICDCTYSSLSEKSLDTGRSVTERCGRLRSHGRMPSGQMDDGIGSDE